MDLPEEFLKKDAIAREQERIWLQTAENTEFSDRSFADYLGVFGLNSEDLKGERVMDLGAGGKQKFAEEAEATGLGIEVVSVNPNLKAGTKPRTMYGMDRERHGQSVAAFSQRMPFRNESFDRILAFASIPQYLNPDDYESSIKEVFRTLKKGGKFHSAPFSLFQLKHPQEFSATVAKLESAKTEINVLSEESADKFDPAKIMGRPLYSLTIIKDHEKTNRS